MAVLSSGLLVVVGGVQFQRVLAISSGTLVRLTMDGSVFPLGITTLSIGISTDGGATFNVASMTCPGGVTPLGGNWVMGYELGPSDVPTHTKIMVDAALGFSSNMTVEVL